MRPQPGDVVGGKYRIVRLIGDGGMGAVFEAKHEKLGTPVALKFLHAELTKRPGLVARFMREAQVSARIQSQHVTRVTDVDETDDGSAYIVMELLTGESLQAVLDHQIKLPAAQAIDFALQILSGLEAAHALGVVHRDLKPDNVFITPSTGGPIVKLLDFGIAKIRESTEYQKGLTRPGAIMGTPEYMAPEQAFAADQVDHRADIYSIGAILYEMLSGDRPAYGDDAQAIVSQVMNGKVRRLDQIAADLPSGLADAVHRALEPVHTRRYASALEMRMALAPFAGELSHAGRLAATPAPAAAATPEPEGPTPTVDEKPLERPSGVPRTLPPADDPPGPAATASDRPPPTGTAVGGGQDAPPATATVGPQPPRGATQEAPKDVMQAISAGAPAAAQPGAGPAPYGAAGAAGAGYANYAPPPVRRRSGKAVGALLALLLGVLVTGGIIAIVVGSRDTDEPDQAPVLGGAPPPATTITAQGPDTPDPPVSPGPGPSPVAPGPAQPRPQPGPGRPRPAKDAGASRPDSGTVVRTDAGPVSPIPPGITLPPGLASAIPPGIPTTIPTVFPIPGFGAPPANSGR